MLISGGNFRPAQSVVKAEIIDLRTPVRTLGPLEEDGNRGMQTSYMDLLDVTVYLPC